MQLEREAGCVASVVQWSMYQKLSSGELVFNYTLNSQSEAQQIEGVFYR